MTYEQALEDHQYLFSIDDARDMTGGYVDQTDLAKLLRSPTKTTARQCLCNQVQYWFQVGTELRGSAAEIAKTYPHVRVIADRHGIVLKEQDEDE